MARKPPSSSTTWPKPCANRKSGWAESRPSQIFFTHSWVRVYVPLHGPRTHSFLRTMKENAGRAGSRLSGDLRLNLLFSFKTCSDLSRPTAKNHDNRISNRYRE